MPARVCSALVLLWALGCGDSAVAPTLPPEEPPVEPLLLDRDPTPVFDFRRGVLHPRELAGSTRSCVVLSVSEAALAADDPRPVTAAAVKLVRCRNRAQGYPVLVLFEEAVGTDALEAPAHELGADRRIDLRLAGLSADGETPVAVFEGARLAAAEPPAVVSASPRAEPRGFDFGQVAEDVSLIGTRRTCAIRAASTVTRVLRNDLEASSSSASGESGESGQSGDGPGDEAEDGPPEVGPGDELEAREDPIVATMPVTCVHDGGRSSVTLRFDQEALADVLLVEPRATAHGTVESARSLRVAHVTAAAP